MKSLVFIVVLSVLFSCEYTAPASPEEADLLDGPIEGLTHAQQGQFLKGDIAFGEVFTKETGLGPLFVANQCSACHAGDGKGTPFVSFFRFGQADTLGNTFLNQGGPQLQQKALQGFSPEALPAGASFTSLIAPAVTGLGYLDAVSDADLIELADPDDVDGDGISGRPHWNNIPKYVTLRADAIENQGRYITRFGKKGGAYDLLHQSAGAYNQDMGIVSLLEPVDPYSGEAEDPEVSLNTLNDIVFYLKVLKAPIRRNENSTDVLAGEMLFQNIQCAACHVAEMKTATSPIAQLSNQTFHPYTDLLLHDMGEGLDDGYTEGFALTSEWKTPALWGLGLSKDAQGGVYRLLHDGRATSISEAILLHGGEALNSKNKYDALSEAEKKQLEAFLESL